MALAVSLAVLALGAAVVVRGLVVNFGALALQRLWTASDLLGVLSVAVVVFGAAFLLRLVRREHRRPVLLVLLLIAVATVFGVGATAGAALVLIACLAVGDVLVSRLEARLSGIERVVLAVLAGIGVLVALVDILAHFPVNAAWLYVPLLVVPIILNRKRLLGHARRLVTPGAGVRDEATVLSTATGALLVFILALHSVRAALPETGGDGLGMHLLIASQMATHHQWAFDVGNFNWALFPMGSEWLLSVGWILGGEPVARALHFAVFLCLVLLIRSQARRVGTAVGADLAAALFASAGVVFGVTANIYTEVVLSVFLLAGFTVVTAQVRRWTSVSALLVGILLGASLLTKVTALYVMIPLLIVFIVRCARSEGGRRAAGLLLTCLASIAVVASLPYVYALVRTGNPVYPLFGSLFGSGTQAGQTNVDFKAKWTGHFSWELPYLMTFFSDRYCEVYRGTLGFQYVALLPAAIVLTIWRRLTPAALALVVAIPSAAALLWTTQYIRYVLPMMAIVMIAVAAVFALLEWRSRLLRAIVVAAAVGLCFLNLAFFPGGAWNLHGFWLRALFSDSARREFVVQSAPERYLNDIVNARDGADARVAYIGVPRASGAGLQGEALEAMLYNPTFRDAVYGATSADALGDVFASRGVDYIIAPQATIDAFGALRDLLARDGTRLAEINGMDLYLLDGDR